jgi:hypothetical protein
MWRPTARWQICCSSPAELDYLAFKTNTAASLKPAAVWLSRRVVGNASEAIRRWRLAHAIGTDGHRAPAMVHLGPQQLIRHVGADLNQAVTI